jgi:multidrug efflux system outer membrane protein
VVVQADAPARMQPDDLLKLNASNTQGKPVPLSAFASTKWVKGAQQTVRYNGYPAMRISGSPAPGYSTGAAMAEMEKLAGQLPAGFGFEWTGQSREEKLAGSQSLILYSFAILAVFLCLAALYESWSIPLAVILVVPLGVLGVLLATLMRGYANDVYFQVGLITIIGLSAKNAILIIEFAKDLQAQGKGLIESALEAAHLRFRPIIMTSMAFGLGVVPLAIASGAGSASQRAIGTGVLGGMVTGTVLAVFFVPVFFVVVRSLFKGSARQQETSWQYFFKDARLKRLIAVSLENNRDLRVAVLTIEQARAQLQVRQADQLPTVNAGITGTRGPATTGTITSTYTAGLSVTAYELDFFGRVRALSQAAQAQLLGTEEARKTVQISLIAAVANTYLALLADDALLRVTGDTLASRQESLRLMQLKFDNEAASRLELSTTQSQLEAAKAAHAQATRQRALDENALVLLVGQSLPADLPVGLPLTEQGLLADLPAGVPSDLLTRRPDIRQAEQVLLANNANIGAARAAFFPRISLTASAGAVSSELDRLFNNGTTAWTFAPQLVLPIFDYGRNAANLESAKVVRDIAVAQYEKAIQTGFREVSDALAGRATLGEQLRAQNAQLAAEQTRMQLTDLRFKHGASSAFEVLDAQRSLFAVQQATLQVQLQQVQNRVTLYKVLGGGWTD